MKRAFLGLALGLAAAGLQAGTFSGTISYRLTDRKGATHDLTMAIAGSKLRTDVVAGGQAVASIMDLDAKTVTTLFAARKAYSVMSVAASGEQVKAPIKAEKTGATDTIAGYQAEEWTVTRDGKASSVWLTSQLGRGFFSHSGPAAVDAPDAWKGKDLVMLRVSRPGGTKVEAVKVDRSAPDASLFSVPDGYSKVASPLDAMGSAGGASPAGAPGAASTVPMGAGTMSPEVAARVQQAMQNLSPEQRAAIQKAMQGQPGAGQ